MVYKPKKILQITVLALKKEKIQYLMKKSSIKLNTK